MSDESSLREFLTQFGTAKSFVDLLSDLPSGTPAIVVRQAASQEPSLNLLGGPDCEAAMYLDASRLWLALDPEEARRLAALTGVTVTAPNTTTARLRITPEDAADPTKIPHLQEAASVALLRSRDRDAVRRSVSAGPGDRPLGSTCSKCGIELPVSGACDDHGRSS